MDIFNIFSSLSNWFQSRKLKKEKKCLVKAVMNCKVQTYDAIKELRQNARNQRKTLQHDSKEYLECLDKFDEDILQKCQSIHLNVLQKNKMTRPQYQMNLLKFILVKDVKQLSQINYLQSGVRGTQIPHQFNVNLVTEILEFQINKSCILLDQLEQWDNPMFKKKLVYYFIWDCLEDEFNYPYNVISAGINKVMTDMPQKMKYFNVYLQLIDDKITLKSVENKNILQCILTQTQTNLNNLFQLLNEDFQFDRMQFFEKDEDQYKQSVDRFYISIQQIVNEEINKVAALYGFDEQQLSDLKLMFLHDNAIRSQLIKLNQGIQEFNEANQNQPDQDLSPEQLEEILKYKEDIMQKLMQEEKLQNMQDYRWFNIYASDCLFKKYKINQQTIQYYLVKHLKDNKDKLAPYIQRQGEVQKNFIQQGH